MSESCVASASGSRVSVEQNAERLYKWGTLLQLETETKARLRPFMPMLGLSVAQDDVRERVAYFFAKSFASKSWREHMEELAGITKRSSSTPMQN